jgi:hypothetical protein
MSIGPIHSSEKRGEKSKPGRHSNSQSVSLYADNAVSNAAGAATVPFSPSHTRVTRGSPGRGPPNEPRAQGPPNPDPSYKVAACPLIVATRHWFLFSTPLCWIFDAVLQSSSRSRISLPPDELRMRPPAATTLPPSNVYRTPALKPSTLACTVTPS